MIWSYLSIPNFNGCTVEVWEWISNSSHILVSMWIRIHARIKVKSSLDKTANILQTGQCQICILCVTDTNIHSYQIDKHSFSDWHSLSAYHQQDLRENTSGGDCVHFRDHILLLMKLHATLCVRPSSLLLLLFIGDWYMRIFYMWLMTRLSFSIEFRICMNDRIPIDVRLNYSSMP